MLHAVFRCVPQHVYSLAALQAPEFDCQQVSIVVLIPLKLMSELQIITRGLKMSVIHTQHTFDIFSTPIADKVHSGLLCAKYTVLTLCVLLCILGWQSRRLGFCCWRHGFWQKTTRTAGGSFTALWYKYVYVYDCVQFHRNWDWFRMSVMFSRWWSHFTTTPWYATFCMYKCVVQTAMRSIWNAYSLA